MNTTLLIISIIFFLISIGSMGIHRTKNSDSLIENSSKGQFLLSILTLLPFTLIVTSIVLLLGLKWYWSMIIAFILNKIISQFLANIYFSLIGYKTKPKFSLIAGGYVKQNMHIVDYLITLFIGALILLYIRSQ
jgi:multisubunit Na+/H+ antiporter MnhG subunit